MANRGETEELNFQATEHAGLPQLHCRVVFWYQLFYNERQ
jgi:hypothetical protein